MSIVASSLIAIPRIAVFSPEDTTDASFRKLFQRPDYSVRFVSTVHDIVHMAKDEGDGFDVIVYPLISHRGPRGTVKLADIKGEATLRSVPILGLSLDKSATFLRSFYEAGVDHVTFGPFDSDALHLEIASLARSGRDHALLRKKTAQDTVLSDPALNMLHALPFGVVIVDAQFSPTFFNTVARKILGATEPPYEAFCGKEIRKTIEILDNHGYYPITEKEVSLQRPFGPPALIRLSVAEITGHLTSRSGYFLSFSELSQYQHLGHTLEQSRRVRRMVTLLASTLFANKTMTTLGITTGRLGAIMEGIQEVEPSTSSLTECLHLLIELLDPVFGSEISITFSHRDQVILPLKRSELFSLLMVVLLWLSEQGGGPTDISVALAQEPNRRIITFLSESQTLAPLCSDPYLQKLVDGAPLSSRDKELPLAIPHEIAARAGIKLTVSSPSPMRRQVQIKIPTVSV